MGSEVNVSTEPSRRETVRVTEAGARASPEGGKEDLPSAVDAFYAVTDKQVEAAYWAIEEHAKKLAPDEYVFPTRDEVLDGCDNMRIALHAAYRAQPAALASPPAQTWAVPDGWTLVPIVPDADMLAAGDDAMVDTVDTDNWLNHCRNAWSAMLGATPLPPVPAGEGK